MLHLRAPIRAACLISAILICHLGGIVADEAPRDRPIGVPAESMSSLRIAIIIPHLIEAALYEEKDEFQCLDGLASIPFAHVNDDYCDCADGSDEPG